MTEYPTDDDGWQETVHLLSSPRNAERIFRAIRQLNAGNGREHALIPAKEASIGILPEEERE